MSKNRKISLTIMTFAALALWQSHKVPAPMLQYAPVGPSFWPTIFSVTLLLLGVLLFLTTCIPFFAAQEQTAAVGRAKGWKNYAKVAEIVVITFVYYVAMFWIGFVASSIAYIVICVLCLAPMTLRTFVISMLVALVLVGGLFYFFYYGMGIFLPPPAWQ